MGIEVIYTLDQFESEWWSGIVKRFRAKYIKTPKEYVNLFVTSGKIKKEKIKSDISKSIEKIRESIWENYLKDEVVFHKEVLTYLMNNRNVPKEILEKILEENFNQDELIDFSGGFQEKITRLVGEYAGRIMPYIYYLSLSTTNSRRSRAGKTFEAVIEYVLDCFGYTYDNQSKLGLNFYKENKIGKMVDCVIPNKEAYSKKRDKCIIITMKTTLRERWQEVVEELNRTNIPHIYLMTLDSALTKNVLTNMERQNITILTYESIESKFKKRNNIISFETFFNEEIPHNLKYWERQK